METKIKINKTKTVNVPIKIWVDKDYVYCNNADAAKYIWGSTTASCDMRRLGLERITTNDYHHKLIHYRFPREILNNRFLDLVAKQGRIDNAIKTLRIVLEDKRK